MKNGDSAAADAAPNPTVPAPTHGVLMTAKEEAAFYKAKLAAPLREACQILTDCKAKTGIDLSFNLLPDSGGVYFIGTLKATKEL